MKFRPGKCAEQSYGPVIKHITVKVYLLVQLVQCVKIIGFALPTDFSISSESFVELAKRQGDLFRILRGAYRLCLPEGCIQAILMGNFSCKYIFREIAIKDKKFLSESTKKQALKNTKTFLECYIFGESRHSLLFPARQRPRGFYQDGFFQCEHVTNLMNKFQFFS